MVKKGGGCGPGSVWGRETLSGNRKDLNGYHSASKDVSNGLAGHRRLGAAVSGSGQRTADSGQRTAGSGSITSQSGVARGLQPCPHAGIRDTAPRVLLQTSQESKSCLADSTTARTPAQRPGITPTPTAPPKRDSPMPRERRLSPGKGAFIPDEEEAFVRLAAVRQSRRIPDGAGAASAGWGVPGRARERCRRTPARNRRVQQSRTRGWACQCQCRWQWRWQWRWRWQWQWQWRRQ